MEQCLDSTSEIRLDFLNKTKVSLCLSLIRSVRVQPWFYHMKFLDKNERKSLISSHLCEDSQTVILSLSLSLKLSLRYIGFQGLLVVFSERLLIFEEMYQKRIENTCIFIKLKPKMYKNVPSAS